MFSLQIHPWTGSSLAELNPKKKPLVVKAAVLGSWTLRASRYPVPGLTTTSPRHIRGAPPIRVHELHRHCNIVVGMSKRGLGGAQDRAELCGEMFFDADFIFRY